MVVTMTKQTALYHNHVAANAKLVSFADWLLPLHYGSQINEHNAVRNNVGIFDVSHMAIIDITGKDASPYLRYLLTNDVIKLTDGKGLYSCMLNEEGMILDDLIAYRLTENDFRIISNASTREQNMAWLEKQARQYDVTCQQRHDLAILAIQGPKAINAVKLIFSTETHNKLTNLKSFHTLTMENYFISRTGYTGEDGVELILSHDKAIDYWQALVDSGVQPCGLGARDSLRLEAGLNLYGTDMDLTTTPFESNLRWTIALSDPKRDFIGHDALCKQQDNIKQCLVGLITDKSHLMRHGQTVLTNDSQEGMITSGGFSPTLNKSIALARIPRTNSEYCEVVIRNNPQKAKIVKPPFVRFGKLNVKITD